MAGQKSVSKSVRLTPELYGYISSYRGDGFNEKFANIIMDARDSEALRKSRLEYYDSLISGRESLLADIDSRLAGIRSLLRGNACGGY